MVCSALLCCVAHLDLLSTPLVCFVVAERISMLMGDIPNLHCKFQAHHGVRNIIFKRHTIHVKPSVMHDRPINVLCAFNCRAGFAIAPHQCRRDCHVQAKERRAFSLQRMLCIGGSIGAIVILIVMMTSFSTPSTPIAREELDTQDGSGALFSPDTLRLQTRGKGERRGTAPDPTIL